MKQKWYNSKVLWLAIIAQLFIIAQVCGVDMNFLGQAKQIINALLEIFVIVGIVNNPTSKYSL